MIRNFETWKKKVQLSDLRYLNNQYIIKINSETIISEILKNYANILNKKLSELYFLYKGKLISSDNN